MPNISFCKDDFPEAEEPLNIMTILDTAPNILTPGFDCIGEFSCKTRKKSIFLIKFDGVESILHQKHQSYM